MDKERFLKNLRPGNESYEHFMLKQIGKRWLYDKGVRHIGTEVYINSGKVCTYGEKTTIDVVGLDRKVKYKFHNGVTRTLKELEKNQLMMNQSLEFLKDHPNKVQEFLMCGHRDVETLIQFLHEKEYDMNDFIEGMLTRKRVNYTLYTLEAKASVSDFRNGFSVAGDYSYVIAPKGVIPKELLPNGIGFLEVDIERALTKKDYKSAVTMSRRVKKMVDPKYLDDQGDIITIYRNVEMESLKDQISVRNVNENNYWNPHFLL